MGKKRKLETKSAGATRSGAAKAAAEAEAPSSRPPVKDPVPAEAVTDGGGGGGGRRDVLRTIHRAADSDPAQRKIFVHGLGWDVTADTLTEAFSPYGEIEDLRVVTDRNTGKCKGYGFILFRRRSGARAALQEPQKKIGNRTTACQLASVGPVPAGGAVANNPAAPAALQLPPVSEYTQRKIFVSNVGADIDPQKLFLFFSKYGEIEEGPSWA
ncbi:hypothetical protein PR202_ga23948 [Eleusine coracana subsp. coracana]|uniref:RRM domain-containing protein n=1 Tax=Eleusine coracana subsp. coracana TaxID=191504 RepID=A0AAV5D7I7_ELECO|nr:hypothetical protein PR202_ga23948 [Eleusine coracana subsp. coracana]